MSFRQCGVKTASMSDLRFPLFSFFFLKSILSLKGWEEGAIKAVSKQISMSKGPESIPELSTNTTLQSFHPPLPLSDPAVPSFLRLFPFFSLHFRLHSCTLSLLLPCPSLFHFAHFKSQPPPHTLRPVLQTSVLSFG